VTEPVVEVTTVRIQRGSLAQRISAPGSVVARRESRIGAELSARIVRIYVAEGDRVEEGQPLFQIDPVAYEMGLRQAQAGVDLARAERLQFEADLKRARTLKRKDVLAAQEIERLTTSVEVARAREKQAQEAVALAQHHLAQTVIRAPYAGSIAKRLADEGTTALVRPQTIVLVLQETGELEAHAAIPESQLAAVQVGDRALVHVEGLTDPVDTTVSMVSDTIDPATRTYLVKMPVPNPGYRIKAGVFAHVELHPTPKGDALLVPRQAIRTEDGRTRVLVVREGRAMAVVVETGVVSEDTAEVVHGIAEGEEVIVGDVARTIAPGMAVRVVGSEGAPS
jgi:RND family efflux transporter MFP subunit